MVPRRANINISHNSEKNTHVETCVIIKIHVVIFWLETIIILSLLFWWLIHLKLRRQISEHSALIKQILAANLLGSDDKIH